eukprot:5968763-Pleurochrysis_carterae.AAC.3
MFQFASENRPTALLQVAKCPPPFPPRLGRLLPAALLPSPFALLCVASARRRICACASNARRERKGSTVRMGSERE